MFRRQVLIRFDVFAHGGGFKAAEGMAESPTFSPA